MVYCNQLNTYWVGIKMSAEVKCGNVDGHHTECDYLRSSESGFYCRVTNNGVDPCNQCDCLRERQGRLLKQWNAGEVYEAMAHKEKFMKPWERNL